MLKKLLVVAVVVCAVLAGVGQAKAVCEVEGRVVDIFTNAAGSSYVYVSLNTSVPNGVWYYFTVSGTAHNALATINAALASGKTVLIAGNASACPTSGVFRNGGALVDVEVY